MFRLQNNVIDPFAAKKIFYSTTAIFILLLSSFYKWYQAIRYLGIPETDTWDFANKSDFIAQNHYINPLFADGVFATHNATLQLILNVPQEYIAIFGGEITFLVPLLFFIIARRCSKNEEVHLIALLIGGFFGLGRTILYAPETFSYIFILLFIYLSGLFYLLNKKWTIPVLLFFISWAYILFHQSAIGAYFALGLFIIINGGLYKNQILDHFHALIKKPGLLVIVTIVLGAILASLMALHVFDPLIGQLIFYLTSAAKIASPSSYSTLIVPSFLELTKNLSFVLLIICLVIVFRLKKYKKLELQGLPALTFYSGFSFFLFFFFIIYILPRTGFEVPVIGRFYTWFQLSTWISVIILLSILVNELNKKFLAVIVAILAIGMIPSSPEINIQFSGTVDTVQSVRNIAAQDLIKPDSILFTQWYYKPSLFFGFSGYSGDMVKKNIEIVQMQDWGWISDDNEKDFSEYFILKTEELNQDQEFKNSYLILSKYLLDFAKTEKSSEWLQAMSNGNLKIERLKSFDFLGNIIYEDEYNILFELPKEFL